MSNNLETPQSHKHKLPMEAKVYVVRALACCERPRRILAVLKEEFGIELHRSTLKHYDPRHNPRLDPHLKALFQRTAAQFWDEESMAPFNSLQHRQELRRQLYKGVPKIEWVKNLKDERYGVDICSVTSSRGCSK